MIWFGIPQHSKIVLTEKKVRILSGEDFISQRDESIAYTIPTIFELYKYLCKKNGGNEEDCLG